MNYIVAFLISFGVCLVLLIMLAVTAALMSPSNAIEQMMDDQEQAEYLREWNRQRDGHSARRKKS